MPHDSKAQSAEDLDHLLSAALYQPPAPPAVKAKGAARLAALAAAEYPAGWARRVRSAAAVAGPAEPPTYQLPGSDQVGRDRSDRRSRLGRAGARGRSWRVLAPALSGLAVVAVVVALTMAGGSSAKRTETGPAASAGVGALPRFYVTVNYRRPRFKVLAHDSATERTLQVRGLSGLGVEMAAISDRDYFIAVYQQVRHDTYADVLYRLRLSDNGQHYTLTKEPRLLKPNFNAIVDGIAVSPSGSELAVVLQVPHSGFHMTGQIEVIQMGRRVARVVRTWAAPNDNALGWDPIWINNTHLAFLWQDHLRGTALDYTGRTQVRLLETTAPGGLLSSRVLASGGHLGFIETAYASPGGPISAATDRNVPTLGVPGTATLRLVALSPATDKVIKTYAKKVVRYHTQVGLEDTGYIYQVLGVDRTGRDVLVTMPGAFGALRGGSFIPLPSGHGQVIGAAW